MQALVDNKRRAAAVLLAMGGERSSAVLAQLPSDVARALQAEVSTLGSLPGPAQRDVLLDLAQEMVARRLVNDGGVEHARAILEPAVGADRTEELLDRVDPVRDKPFGYLAASAPDVVAQTLASEPPSTVALALAHLDPPKAAAILRAMPAELQGDLGRRVAGLQHVHASVVSDVDADLRRRLVPILEQPVSEIEGVNRLVEILNMSSQDTERAMLAAIEQEDPDLASRIREALFVFEDILKLDDKAVQQVLKTVDSRDLAVSLKDSDPEVAELIFRNLSERARENLQEEIEFLKGIKASDIKEARKRVIAAIRVLEEAGAITIARGGGEEA